MNKLVYLSGLGLILVAVAFSITHYSLATLPGVTEANVRRIREGMTLSEVEAILGSQGTFIFEIPGLGLGAWSGDRGTAYVEFGSDQLVQSKRFVPFPPTEQRLTLPWSEKTSR